MNEFLPSELVDYVYLYTDLITVTLQKSLCSTFVINKFLISSFENNEFTTIPKLINNLSFQTLSQDLKKIILAEFKQYFTYIPKQEDFFFKLYEPDTYLMSVDTENESNQLLIESLSITPVFLDRLSYINYQDLSRSYDYSNVSAYDYDELNTFYNVF